MVEFVDELPNYKKNARRKPAKKYDGIVNELRNNPGVWARVIIDTTSPALKNHLETVYPGIEAVTRRPHNYEVGHYDIHARALSEERG